MRLWWLVLCAMLLPIHATRAADFALGGGGGAGTDCVSVFFGAPNYPASAPRHFRCSDGAACDADGVVNGECQIPLAACLNSSFDPAHCSSSGVAIVSVDHALDNGDPRFDPQFQAFQTRIDALGIPNTTPDACSVPTQFRIEVKGPFFQNTCYRGTKTLRLQAVSTLQAGQVRTDVDFVRLQCDPSPTAGCDPQVFYTGTFDRVQRQIFDRSCAVSGCHDSQSQMAGLLLESGASLTNLVGVDPLNSAALAAGWKRITPGSTAASLLLRKLKTLPAGGYGDRMPRGRPRLNDTLITVIERWIEAGAPETGWVPGTY